MTGEVLELLVTSRPLEYELFVRDTTMNVPVARKTEPEGWSETLTDPVAWTNRNAASELSRVVVVSSCAPLAANVNTCSDTDFADNASSTCTADSVPPATGSVGATVSAPDRRTVLGVETRLMD